MLQFSFPQNKSKLWCESRSDTNVTGSGALYDQASESTALRWPISSVRQRWSDMDVKLLLPSNFRFSNRFSKDSKRRDFDLLSMLSISGRKVLEIAFRDSFLRVSTDFELLEKQRESYSFPPNVQIGGFCVNRATTGVHGSMSTGHGSDLSGSVGHWMKAEITPTHLRESGPSISSAHSEHLGYGLRDDLSANLLRPQQNVRDAGTTSVVSSLRSAGTTVL